MSKHKPARSQHDHEAMVLNAVEYVIKLVREGWEFPDACMKATALYSVGHDELREAYDAREGQA